MFQAVDHEIQRLELSVETAIVEIDEFNFVGYAKINQVLPCESAARLVERPFQQVGVHRVICHVFVVRTCVW